MIGTDASQEVDTYGLSIPITKHNFLVNSAEELLEVIPRAFTLAASGRPGPVLVDIPKDVQAQAIEVSQWPAPGGRQARPAPDMAAIEKAATMINAAERPILYLGGGVVHSGAAEAAVALAEKASLPTTMTLMALGAMPVDHPLSIHMLGMHGARYTNLLLEECDLLIAVGARFDDRATGKVAAFCPKAQIIHIDIDPSELDKIKNAHVGIAGDVGEVLEKLSPLVEAHLRKRWLTHMGDLRSRFRLQRPNLEDPRSHYGLIQAVADCLDDSAAIATDVASSTRCGWPRPTPCAGRASGSPPAGLGTMGFGVPTALGAALAEPERTVVCFTGDGSILMNIQELATICRSRRQPEDRAHEQRRPGPGCTSSRSCSTASATSPPNSPVSPTFSRSPKASASIPWTWTPPPIPGPPCARPCNGPAPASSTPSST